MIYSDAFLLCWRVLLDIRPSLLKGHAHRTPSTRVRSGLHVSQRGIRPRSVPRAHLQLWQQEHGQKATRSQESLGFFFSSASSETDPGGHLQLKRRQDSVGIDQGSPMLQLSRSANSSGRKRNENNRFRNQQICSFRPRWPWSLARDGPSWPTIPQPRVTMLLAAWRRLTNK